MYHPDVIDLRFDNRLVGEGQMKNNHIQKLAAILSLGILVSVTGCGNQEASDSPQSSDQITTDSGLIYEIVTQGDGPKPGVFDKVTVHYRGTLTDGTEFDSSYSRGQPATFPVNGVIKGWTEALRMMPTGSKWKLTIPPHLAYGKKGAGRDIGPNATLNFEVELLKIN